MQTMETVSWEFTAEDHYVDSHSHCYSNIPIYAYKGDNGQMVPVKMFDGTEYMSGGTT